MGFPLGKPRPATAGRKKGSLNKRTGEFINVLERRGFNPAEELIDCYKKAKKIFDSYGTIYEALCKSKENSGNPFPVEDKAHVYLKIAVDTVKDIASYSYPKLKSIEKPLEGPLDGMTAEQKLEAMREAVKALEMQIGKKE